MAKIIRLKAHDNSAVEFYDEIKGAGGVKDCYFSVDGSYAVLFFRDALDAAGRDRLMTIVTRFRDGIFNQSGGEYWKNLYCWPDRMVEWDNKTGITCPFYKPHFFFEYGSKNGDFLQIKGKEKEGRWFASANNRKKFLDPRELGNWATHIRVALLISRAVRRMHMAGLAHSDLSYKNVLVDPKGGFACIIDIDGLVVPGKFPPDVVGTPDFIAPEVIATNRLAKNDPLRKLPCIATDCHALAVLIYMYLLYRHPLRGGKVHDQDTNIDEELSMGKNALFVEHPSDKSNRIKLADVRVSELPWANTQDRPYTLTGPYISPLILRAFVDGLHTPNLRPSAAEWEQALIKTTDLLQPCKNPDCEQGWYVFDNSNAPRCPYCNTPFKGQLPVLNLYYATHKEGQFRPENHRLMVYSGQSIYAWHVNRNIAPNEKLTDVQKKRAGYFIFHNNQWLLVNENMSDLYDVTTKTSVAIGGKVALVEGSQILMSKGEGSRLMHVQLVACD